MKYLFIIMVLIGLISCNNGKNAIGTSYRSYNLDRPVKFVSEKTIPILFDSSWHVNIDTALIDEISYKNLLFNEKGFIIKSETYNNDSVLFQSSEYIYSNSGTLEKVNIYKNEKLIEIVKDVNQRRNFLKTKTFDNTTGKQTNVHKITFDDQKIVKKRIWKKIDNSKQKINYEFDSSENVTKMTRKSDYFDGHEYLLFKYLEFDNYGNWTKRIFYDPSDYGNGSLTIRNILYK